MDIKLNVPFSADKDTVAEEMKITSWYRRLIGLAKGEKEELHQALSQ